MQRLAVHLADEIGGDLAGAEAGHAYLRRDLLHLGGDPVIDVLGGNGQGIGALEAFIDGFDDLHFFAFLHILTGPKRQGTGAGEGTRTPTSCDTGT